MCLQTRPGEHFFINLGSPFWDYELVPDTLCGLLFDVFSVALAFLVPGGVPDPIFNDLGSISVDFWSIGGRFGLIFC